MRFLFPESKEPPRGKPEKVIRYYDRACKSWVGYCEDANGNQVTDAQYTYSKADISMDVSSYTEWK